MAVAAHPDDIEFVMAGTLILLREAGYEIHYMNIANGCCGSSEHSAAHTAEIRAARGAGRGRLASAPSFIPSLVNDLEIFYDHETLARLAAVMREVAPEILLVHSPIDYMEDHMNACRLAVTAAFARGMPNYPTESAAAAGRSGSDDLSCPAARQPRSAGPGGAARACSSTSAA